MLHKKSLPKNTKRVFDALSASPHLKDFVLIGGTALSLQVNHRLSEDLDFWLPDEQLNKQNLSRVIQHLNHAGFDCKLITKQSAISAAKINGYDLLSYAQDYEVDGVNITFMARKDAAYKHFSKMNKIQAEGISFSISEKNSIFAMKSWVISKRVKSRDLFDLMYFLKAQGKTVHNLFQAGLDADPINYLPQVMEDVLTGVIPLDKDDQGFSAVNVKDNISDIYRFFQEKIDAYYIEKATGIVEDALKDEVAISAPSFRKS